MIDAIDPKFAISGRCCADAIAGVAMECDGELRVAHLGDNCVTIDDVRVT